MFVILIVVCVVNLVLLTATCALLNYIAKRRGRSSHPSCSRECQDIEGGNAYAKALAPAGYSCVTLGSEGVYVMPSSEMQYPISKGTPFGTTKKITKGPSPLDASTFLSSTVSSFNNSLDSFGVTLNGILSLNAQLEHLQQQTGEQITSTRISTDLGEALDQVLSKHGGGSSCNNENSFSLNIDHNRVPDASLVRISQGTAGSMESGYGSGLMSEDLGVALENILRKHKYREGIKEQRKQAQQEEKITIKPSTFIKTW